jgi:signal transduction histidine kinase
VEALRKYIYELRAVDEFREGLSSRLEDLAERMANAYPTTIHLDVEGTVDDVEPRIAEELLKLVTEAVSNALRHSRADDVTIAASRDPGGVAVVISDNGLGFDPDTIDAGMGLLNMRERVQRLGGTFDVDTVPGTGTKVSIRLSGL